MAGWYKNSLVQFLKILDTEEDGYTLLLTIQVHVLYLPLLLCQIPSLHRVGFVWESEQCHIK